MNIDRRFLLKAGGCLIASQGAVSTALAAVSPADLSVDVLIYGGTAGGVMAACAAAREGARVALVLAGPLGGMPAQGLCWSDTGGGRFIGGLAMRFFMTVAAAYKKTKPVYHFEPSVAYGTFRAFLDEAGVALVNGPYVSAVLREGRRVTAVRLSDGSIVKAKAFIDASYEGDFLAAAGCAYRVGRESPSEFHEGLAGFDALRVIERTKTRDVQGRLFAALRPYPAERRFSADSRIQSYTFRLCLSDDPANMRGFAAPPGYDADRYLFEIHQLNAESTFAPGATANDKFDLNGDYFGASWRWPEATRAQRRAIFDDHHAYQAGLLHCYATDPRVPKAFREQVNAYGLAKDEFTSSDNWPRQLYIREARRLRGRYVMRARDCTTAPRKEHSIGVGAYDFDSHATALLEVREGVVDREGTFGSLETRQTVPYQIPYECLLALEYDNLLVSVCVSATHMAFSSMRMEPRYMIMGEAAGCAAGLVARRGVRSVDLAADMNGILTRYGAVTSFDA